MILAIIKNNGYYYYFSPFPAYVSWPSASFPTNILEFKGLTVIDINMIAIWMLMLQCIDSTKRISWASPWYFFVAETCWHRGEFSPILSPPSTHTHNYTLECGATGITSHRAGAFEASERTRCYSSEPETSEVEAISPPHMQIRLIPC